MIRIAFYFTTLLMLMADLSAAYEVFGSVVACAGQDASNSQYGASFSAGLPVIGGCSNDNFRVDHSFWTPAALVGVPGPAEEIPVMARLYQNHPNPFGNGTTFAFDVSGANGGTEQARLDIFDIHGRLVKTLFDGSFAPGRHESRWDGVGECGQRVRSGIYLARYRAGAISRTVRMVVMK